MVVWGKHGRAFLPLDDVDFPFYIHEDFLSTNFQLKAVFQTKQNYGRGIKIAQQQS